jgi:hypothetical protein
MNALANVISSLPLATVWNKIKLGLLLGATGFMIWQGWQMSSLQQDVTKLEANQTTLQAQVQQMSVDYSVLRDNYKNSAQTSEQYIQSLNQLNGKSNELEKSFTALDKKADTALSMQRKASAGTTPGVNHETSSTQARTGPAGASGGGATDAEWRQLLDNTFCTTFPADNRCSK